MPSNTAPAIPDLSRRQLGQNVIANLSAFGLGIISAFFLTPFWIKKFGVAGYGIVPLVTNIVAYFTLISLMLNLSVGRFLTIAVGQKDYERAERIFNTSVFGAMAAGVVMLCAGFCLWPFIGNLVRVPAGYGFELQIMFILVLLTLVIATASTPFGVAMFCANRLDLNSRIEIINRLIMISVSTGLVVSVYPKPSALSAAALVGSVYVVGANYHYWRKLMPWMHLRLGNFDWRILKDQAVFGGWIVLNQMGAILFLYIDLFVVNRMVGPTASGQYAVLLQWSVLLRSFSTALAAPFAPATMHHFANGDTAALVEHLRLAIRLMGFAVSLPVILIAGFAKPLLGIWLGADFESFAPLLTLIILPLAVNQSIMPLLALQQAMNKVKTPAIVTCLLGFANLGLAVILSGKGNLGMFGVAMAGAVTLSVKNLLFTTLYSAHILKKRWSFFVKETLQIATLMAFTTGVARVLAHLFEPRNWFGLLTLGTIAVGCYVALAWCVLFTKKERNWIKEKLGIACSVKPVLS